MGNAGVVGGLRAALGVSPLGVPVRRCALGCPPCVCRLGPAPPGEVVCVAGPVSVWSVDLWRFKV